VKFKKEFVKIFISERGEACLNCNFFLLPLLPILPAPGKQIGITNKLMFNRHETIIL